MVISRNKLVRGVGINDADYVTIKNATVNGKKVIVWRCKFYLAWAAMLCRCYSDEFKIKWPTYIGCSMVDEWHKFSNFRNWMVTQNWEGMVADKDILFPNNKVYGPETCIFIPEALNLFLTDRGKLRGEWPIGVCWEGRCKKYQAKCRNPFTRKQEHLGLFDCPQVAHEAWRQRKHQHACTYADMQTDPRIAQALRTRYLVDKESI